MKEKAHKLVTYTKSRIQKAPTYIKQNKKRAVWIGLLIVAVLVIILLVTINKKKKLFDSTTVIPVTETNLVSTIKANGKITSQVDLELSFKSQDVVKSVNVSVGDRVFKGQILATLQNQNELGAVTSARGGLASAQASLARTLEGATTEEVRVAQVFLDNATKDLDNTKKTQNKAIENARRALWSNGLTATPVTSFSDQSISSPTVYGTYTGTTEGTFTIDVYQSSGGYAFNTSGLSSLNGMVSASNTVSIGNGLALQFPSNFTLGSNKTWTIKIPNKESAVYTTNLNTYESVKSTADSLISSAQSVVDQRQAELDLKKAQARPADVDARRADVLRAQGTLESALGVYENTIIRAPASGVITKVDIKPGELSKSLTPVITLQDIDNLYVEANINESNITTVKQDQPVSFTIDAFGSSQIFSGVVTQVEPGATITDGIVNYKVKSTLTEKNPLIKPGMNANLTITTGTKEHVLAIPGATITKTDTTMTVKKIIDSKKKKSIVVPVTTGIVGDGNMTEILSGLVLGDSVALVEKQK